MVDEQPPPPPPPPEEQTPPSTPPPAPPPAPPVAPPPAPGYAPPGYAPPTYAPPGYGQVPPPPPPGYGTSGPGYPYATTTEGTAIAAFVVALAGLFVCGVVTGIVALVLANNAQQKISASGGRLTGSGFVTAARVIAIISIVLSVLGIVLVIAAS